MTSPVQHLSTVIASLMLVGLGLTAAPHAQARELSFDDRVAAQKAIEQVYWNHRIWPKENPGPKPALSAVMPDEAIRARVEDYLEKSNALETWWHRPVTAEQLQAELDRMAANTRDGETLRELYRALGNDPFVIAETLARQTLVERLIRNWYASDTRFQGALKAKAEAELSTCADVDCMKAMGGEYHEMTWVRRDTGADEWTSQLDRLATAFGAPAEALPIARLSRLLETPEAFAVSAVRSQREGEVAITSVVWPKRSFDAWWAVERAGVSPAIEAASGTYVAPFVPSTVCTNDSWTPTSTGANVPTARYRHTLVWTGTEMITWGGVSNASLVNTGGRYLPSTDSWTPTSTGANVPAPRDGHTSVWTGTEMIVWGANNSGGLNTGGRYSPVTDTWLPTSTASGVPEPRHYHSAVWSGTEMIVWGGKRQSTILNSGGRYKPASDSWTATSVGANVPSLREEHTAVWTGSEMIVWGGWGGFSFPTSGGRYDPSSNTWTPTPLAAVPRGRYHHSAVWTGSELIVWGGLNDGNALLNSGARYIPHSDSWSATSLGANVPTPRGNHTAVWTGTEMIVWGGSANGFTNTGGRYIPATDSWLATSTGIGVPLARDEFSAVWTGTEMIVWGGSAGAAATSTGARYCACPGGRLSYRDLDGDGYGNASVSNASCDGSIPAGYVVDDTDCNDANALIHPGATESCNGLDDNCDRVVDGSAATCSDGNNCTQTDTCVLGTCVGSPVTCTASDQCHNIGTCNPGTGLCSDPVKADGSACSDGDFCTSPDTCQGGVCSAGGPVVCTASDQCHDAGVCIPMTGCTNPAKVDGTVCSDGTACTQTDTCQTGVCTGTNPVTCTASNQCHDAGTCDPQSGVCSTPAKADGVACTDANSCTQTDTCQAGTCIGSNPVLCAAPDQCHVAGVCQPANGQCSNPAKPNGTACEDGNTCSTGDACSSGSCSGTGGDAAPDVESVSASKSGETVTFDWSATAGAISYDVLRGRVRDFPVGSNPTTETCFDDVVAPTANDATVPPSDSGFWYLFRAEYACGNGSYGWAESHGAPTAPRLSGTCP